MLRANALPCQVYGLRQFFLQALSGPGQHLVSCGRLEILTAWIEANEGYDRLISSVEAARDLIDAGQEFASPWHEAEGHLRLCACLLGVADMDGADEEARLLVAVVEKNKLERFAGWIAAYGPLAAKANKAPPAVVLQTWDVCPPPPPNAVQPHQLFEAAQFRLAGGTPYYAHAA